VAVRRRTLIWVGAAVLAVLAAVTIIWFQPQKLFYDQAVDEALPTADGGSGGGSDDSVELASGSFVSREHETTGTVRILRLADDRVVVRFEDFETSNGPVLVVWLSQNPADGEDDAFDDDYFALGPLKGNVGDQNYVVPAEVDPTGWTSVVVWCDRFDVSFGAADLAASET
jgi:hypothetical protein